LRSIDTVVFDIGNVLIPWNPRWLFNRLLPNEAAVERFLAEVDFTAWNLQHDAGQPFAAGIESHGRAFPHYRHLFEAYFEHWEDSLGEPIDGTVALARRLRAAGYRTLALTNFSAETFPRAVRLHPYLDEFEGVVVSGVEKLTKPDPAIYRLLCERYSVVPARALFIDDSAGNVEGARSIGMQAVHFRSVDRLEQALLGLGIHV
jgi:2-haloacid dehalogenase